MVGWRGKIIFNSSNMSLSSPNYSTVQEQLRIMKSGTEQEKSRLTPESIADVRKYITEERALNGRNYSLEWEFREWEDLIQKYESARGAIVWATQDAVSTTPRSIDVTLSESINILDTEWRNPSLISAWKKITLTLPPNDKTIQIGWGNMIITEVLLDGKKVWIQKNHIAVYLQSAIPSKPTTPSPQTSNGVDEIREALSEINPENLEKAITTSEKFINMIPFPETKNTLRGVHGAVIFQILRDAGHNLTMQNGQITIIPKPGTDVVNLQEKLQTLVNTGRISLETIKMGMLYSSPSFKAYAENKKTKDVAGKDIIDPKANAQDFMTYLRDLQKAGNKSRDIQSILWSGNFLQWVNMQQAIKWFQDMGQIWEWMQKNPAAAWAAMDAVPGVAGASSTSPWKATPPSPAAWAPARDVTWSENGMARAAWELGKWISGAFGKIASQPNAILGIFAAFLGTWYFKDFKTAFGAVLGIFGITAGWDIFSRNKDSLGQATQSAANAASSAGNAVAWAASSAAAAAGLPWAAPAAGPANAPTNDFQKDLRKKVEASGIGAEVDKLAANKSLNKPGKLDDYLKFIEVDLKDIPLSKLFPTDHKKSIFFDNFDTEFSVDNKLSGKMLKRVLREYLTGNQALTGNGDQLGIKEKDAFLALHKITPADIQNKKLSDILESVHKARTGWTSPAPATAPAPAEPTTTNNNLSPIASTIKIGNADKKPGENVQTSENVIVRKEDGNYYDNPNTRLPKDPVSQKIMIPKDGVVKIGDNTQKVNGHDYVAVEYKGEKVYVAITHLKP
jgi:hypothetical protein